jgi:hypothetical protein
MEHTLTLTCECGTHHTSSAPKRYLLVILVEQSDWTYEPTPDGFGHIATCGECNRVAAKFIAQLERKSA